MMDSADIVIVGAGPVGLWTAIQIKIRCPDLRIVMHERRELYIRSHILKVAPLSFRLYSKKDHGEKQWRAEFLDTNKTGFSMSTYMRTNDLESILKQRAQEAGIEIKIDAVETPAVLEAKYPTCRFFIAADGAHSKMRTQLFPPKAVWNKVLQYVVEFKYETEGAARKLGPPKDMYRTSKLLNFPAFEHVGREKNSRTPVTIRFFVDRATYNALEGATFRDPATLSASGLPERIRRDLSLYLNVRMARANEAFIPHSGKLTKITLSTYASKKFAKAEANAAWFLVGDAAMGVPYFRALNSGLICGSKLACIITRHIREEQGWQKAAAAYNAYSMLRRGVEFTIAFTKNMCLNMFNMYRQISAMVPWQTIKWDADTAAQYKAQMHYAFFEEN